MNTKERIIKGHYLLHLIVGNKYRVSYGENQGIYVYKGQIEKGESGGDFSLGASLFVNIENRHRFCYFGTTTPYEFTTIVHPID